MKTLAIVKPDAVKNGAVGFCIQMAEVGGLRVRNLKWIHMTLAQAGAFYLEHFGRPYYDKLVDFMASGPSVVVVLEGKDAVRVWRTIMKGVREVEASRQYSERNAVHGSDSEASAAKELSFFFTPEELGEDLYPEEGVAI